MCPNKVDKIKLEDVEVKNRGETVQYEMTQPSKALIRRITNNKESSGYVYLNTVNEN